VEGHAAIAKGIEIAGEIWGRGSPAQMGAYLYLGHVEFMNGDLDAAAVHLGHGSVLMVEPAVWRYFARSLRAKAMRLPAPGPPYGPFMDEQGWNARLLELVSGRLSGPALLVLARSGPERAQAAFFAALRSLERGRASESRYYFKLVLATRQHSMPEYEVARFASRWAYRLPSVRDTVRSAARSAAAEEGIRRLRPRPDTKPR
jgi:hypothetical protein